MKNDPAIHPGYHAAAGIIMAPVVAFGFVALGICVLLAWPIIPFWLYREKRRENRKSAEELMKGYPMPENVPQGRN